MRGGPGLSPGTLSLVTVLQFAEGLTDRQAAAMAVRAIDWKYALGMKLTDIGFDAGVLCRFRARIADNDVTPPPRERGGFSLCRVGVATDQPGP
ncbi:transposase [Streptomyces sp. NPDC092307]|uniref:transposase n=1 Tax=Streptomyces sp. NPDC092307 TaxID=3366013 RepID=UPI0037FA4ED6